MFWIFYDNKNCCVYVLIYGEMLKDINQLFYVYFKEKYRFYILLGFFGDVNKLIIMMIFVVMNNSIMLKYR